MTPPLLTLVAGFYYIEVFRWAPCTGRRPTCFQKQGCCRKPVGKQSSARFRKRTKSTQNGPGIASGRNRVRHHVGNSEHECLLRAARPEYQRHGSVAGRAAFAATSRWVGQAPGQFDTRVEDDAVCLDSGRAQPGRDFLLLPTTYYLLPTTNFHKATAVNSPTTTAFQTTRLRRRIRPQLEGVRLVELLLRILRT